MASSFFLSSLPLFILLPKKVKFVKVSLSDVLVHLKPNLVLLIPIIAVSMYRSMDKVMIGFLKDSVELGYYENADKIVNLCIGVVTSLGVVMLPKSSNLIEKGEYKKNAELVKKSFLFCSYLCSALCFGIFSISDIFVDCFFGDSFEKTSLVLSILCFNTFLLAFSNIFKTQLLIPREKDIHYIICTIIGALINFIVNIFIGS